MTSGISSRSPIALSRHLLKAAVVSTNGDDDITSLDPRTVPFTLHFYDGAPVTVRFQGSGSEPASLWTTIDSVKRVAALGPDWDSYGARAVSPRAFVRLLPLLPALLTDETPAPSVVPHPSGGLALEWHQGGYDLEVSVSAAGAIQWSLSTIDDEEPVAWDTDSIPHKVREALLRMAGKTQV